MNVHETRTGPGQRDGMHVCFLTFVRLNAQENKNQHSKPEAPKCKRSDGKFIQELGEYQLVKHDWLAGTASWGLPGCNSSQWPGCPPAVHGWNAWPPLSGQPAYRVPWMCTCDFWVPEGRKAPFCLTRPDRWGDTPMSTNCLTLAHWRRRHCCHRTLTVLQGGPLGVELQAYFS